MREIKSKSLIYLKGFLFLLIAVLSSFYVLAPELSFIHTLLFVVSVWSFCRFYYFMFYVIENYVDSNYRFSGIGSFLSYVFKRR